MENNPNVEVNNDEVVHKSSNLAEIDNIQQMRDEKNNEYLEILETNPDSLFDEVTKELISKWKIMLYSSLQIEDFVPLPEIHKLEDIKYSKTIRNDINRTRAKESVLIPNYKEQLEYFIIYFCTTNKIEYKQGLNETIGALLLLKHKFPISNEEIYYMFFGFICSFYINYYFEKDLYSLKSSMALVKILMKYHEPTLYNTFESCGIVPEMYSLSWLMTGFAGKMRINHLYHFWNYLIRENDYLFLHYILIAFLKIKKPELEIEDTSLLVIILGKLAINSIEEIDEMYKIAVDLRKNTPYSFRFLANLLQIFKPNSTHLKEMYEIIKPDDLVSMPIFPNEILHFSYGDTMICPDESCPKTKILEINNDNDFTYNDVLFNCEHCKQKIKKDIQYVFLDLRVLDYQKKYDINHIDASGLIPKLISIPVSELDNNNVIQEFINRFTEDKSLYHFVLLPTKTEYFININNNYFCDADPNIINAYETISDEPKNLKDIGSQSESKKAKKVSHTQEVLRNLIKNLIKNNFPYISYAYGGYYSIHQQCFNYNLSLVEHNEKKCRICKDILKTENKKSTAEKQKKLDELNLPREKINQVKAKLNVNELNCFMAILLGSTEQFNRKIYVMFNGKQIELYRIFKSVPGYSKEEEVALICSISIHLIKKISFYPEEKNLLIIKYRYSEFDKEEAIKLKSLSYSEYQNVKPNKKIKYNKTKANIYFLLDKEKDKFVNYLHTIKFISLIERTKK